MEEDRRSAEVRNGGPTGNTRDYGKDSNHPESTRKYQGLSRNKLHKENNSKCPLFLISNFWELYITIHTVLRTGTDFVTPEFVDSYFPPHGISPPPPR